MELALELGDVIDRGSDGQNSPMHLHTPEHSLQNSSEAGAPVGIVSSTVNSNNSPLGKSIIPAPAVSQQTRHARRIYVGGIPAGYADEDTLKSFLNAVISKGLNEENDNSYVLSVYINQKKCFTFVEFKSIELTTACLELDGLIYYSSVLKVLRANEYKPELLPPSHNPPIKLYLPASAFGTPIIGPTPPCCCDSPGGSNDIRLDYTFIQTGSVTIVERDSIALIGFPYDDSLRKTTGRAGSSVSPKAIRNILKKYGAGFLNNPEYGANISQVAIFDIGDISPSLPFEEAHSRLVSTVAEVVRRGGIPFILGGSSEQSMSVASGLLSVMGSLLGVVNINSQLDVRTHTTSDGKIGSIRPFRQLLDDVRFCPARSSPTGNSVSCDGRLVIFGAQGANCSSDQSTFVTSKGGKIVWLSRDLRHQDKNCSARDTYKTGCPQSSFQRVLEFLGTGGTGQGPGSRRPVYVSVNAGAMAHGVCPGGAATASSSKGLTADEILDIALISGTDPNVIAMDVSEIIPEMEEPRSAKLFVDILYHFAVGLSMRLAAANEMKALNLGPSAFQVPGSTTSTPSPNSFSPQFASKVVAGATPPLQVQAQGQGQGLGQGSVCGPACTESEKLQAAYHAQQQHLRHHQQQLKQRAVTHPSLLGPLTDINTGQIFNRDPNGAVYRSGRHGSCEEVTVGPSVQRAFDYDAATQEFAHRDALRLLDQTGQRSNAQDRKYSQYQSMNYPGQGQGQGQLFQGGLGFGSQQTQQASTQSTPSSPHESLKASHTQQQQQQGDGYLSPFSFNRSTSGPQLGTRHAQQQQQSIHGLGQGQGLGHGQGQGQGPSSRHQSQQQQQLQLHLQQMQQQQQQQQHAIHSRGAISGAPPSSLGLIQNTNRGRSRDGPGQGPGQGPTRNQQTLAGQQSQGQGLNQGQSQSQHLHGLHGVMGDFEYDDPHTNPYLGGIRSLSPGPSSRTSSNASMNGDYPGDFSFGGSLMSASGTNSRGYDLGDVLLRLGGDRDRENEDYTVGNVSRRPSYTMNSNSSPRPSPSDVSVLLQQQQHDTNYEGYEAHLNARRVTSPRQSDQLSYYDSMGVPNAGNMAGTGTGSVGQGQGQSPGPGGGGGGV